MEALAIAISSAARPRFKGLLYLYTRSNWKGMRGTLWWFLSTRLWSKLHHGPPCQKCLATASIAVLTRNKSSSSSSILRVRTIPTKVWDLLSSARPRTSNRSWENFNPSLPCYLGSNSSNFWRSDTGFKKRPNPLSIAAAISTIWRMGKSHSMSAWLAATAVQTNTSSRCKTLTSKLARCQLWMSPLKVQTKEAGTCSTRHLWGTLSRTSWRPNLNL